MPSSVSSAPSEWNSTDAAHTSVPRGRYLIFLSLAIGGCAIDLAAKSWVFGRLGMPGEQDVWWLWPGVAGFQTSLNEGALFGMGQGMSRVFAGFSVLAAFGIVYWLFVAKAAHDRLLTFALGMISGGIWGNLYDRLALHGLRWGPDHELAGEPIRAVRDYVLVMIGDYHWPNFNVADSLLVCGAALLVAHAFFSNPQSPKQTPAAN